MAAASEIEFARIVLSGAGAAAGLLGLCIFWSRKKRFGESARLEALFYGILLFGATVVIALFVWGPSVVGEALSSLFSRR